jgi:phage regulator Rha-like protein
MQKIIATEHIVNQIFFIRGHKVMLDSDLAELYGVLTKNLNKAVSRNTDRFPKDFMFQLTEEELGSLRFQFGTSNKGRGGRRYLPYAFTQEGIAMLSSVLKSKRAIAMNIAIMRAFVKLREILSTHKELAAKLDALERKVGRHDQEIHAILEAIRQLMAPPPEKKQPFIGFGPAKK